MDLEEQYEKLLKYCYMKVNDVQIAEDIVQETFLKFWRSKSYKDTGRKMAFLYTVARNLCIDYSRKHKPDLPGDDALVCCTDNCMENDCLERIVIKQAMEKLPDDDREIVMLCFVNGLSLTEAGKILGLSRFAVNRRLKKAKEILKKELEG